MGKDERVMCVRRTLVEDIFGKFQGYLPLSYLQEMKLKRLLDPSHVVWLPRSFCETRQSYQQIIPYCLLAQDDTFYRYRRVNVSEERLKGNWSLGVGGHVNLVDAADTEHDIESLRGALLRELDEEIKGISPDCKIKVVGLINVDDDEVGSVHTGVICLAKGVGGEVKDKTLEHAHGHMLPMDEIILCEHNYEAWSRVCIPYLQEMLLKRCC